MKKSYMINKIESLLKIKSNATDILDMLVKEGMLPPYSKQRDLGCECGCHGWCSKGHDWDYEHLPDNSFQTNRG